MSTTVAPDTIAEHDVDTFVLLLDDEPDVPCAVSGCDAVAEWATRCPKCLHDFLMCIAHRQVVDHESARLAVLGLSWLCGVPVGGGVCGTPFTNPVIWRPV